MTYVKQEWKNLPNQTTPLSAARLNHLETQFDEAKSYVDQQVAANPGPEGPEGPQGPPGESGTPFVEGVPLYSYGHSYTKVPSNYTTPDSAEHPLVVAKRLHMGKVYPRGRGGTPLIDTLSLAMSSVFNPSGEEPRVWGNDSRGVALLENYMNELNMGGGWITQPYVDYWGLNLRSMFAVLSSQSGSNVAGATLEGSWVDVNGDIAKACRGGQLKRASSTGSTATWNVPSGDEVWVVTLARTTGGGGFTVTCGSQTLLTVPNTNFRSGVNYTSVILPTVGNEGPVALRVTGLNSAAGTTGAKTVTITTTSNSNTFISALLFPATDPVQIFYGLEPPRVGSPNYTTGDPLYRAKVAEIAAEFPNVHVVDLAPGYDSNSMISSLDPANPKFHPNDYGQQHIAGKYVDAINATITAPTKGVQTL